MILIHLIQDENSRLNQDNCYSYLECDKPLPWILTLKRSRCLRGVSGFHAANYTIVLKIKTHKVYILNLQLTVSEASSNVKHILNLTTQTRHASISMRSS
jgi:hypothetical protein